MGHRALIGGGVRSGKSAFALRWAHAHGQRRAFIATAQLYDDEMRQRVLSHQAERGDRFRTFEAPMLLEDVLSTITETDVVVIDCLTLWLSNLLLAEVPSAVIEKRVVELARVLKAAPFASIIVSNEVGMGIVPDNALARAFRDVAGRAHQLLAAEQDEMFLATMGVVMRLRPAPIEVVFP